MRSIKINIKRILKFLYALHIKTSSWVAGIIGPMVFNFGTKDKNWNISTSHLLTYP